MQPFLLRQAHQLLKCFLHRNAGDDGEQNPGNNLHVSGVSLRVTERDLDEAFGKFGKVN